MSSICGVAAFEGYGVEFATTCMLKRMLHRGDGQRFIHSSRVRGWSFGVGAQYPKPSRAGAPLQRHFADKETGDFAVIDGHFASRHILIQKLRSEGVVLQHPSDAELVVRAVQLWGDAAMRRLEGPFAFALFHASTSRLLFARDVFGLKPLYVARTEKMLAFASTVSSLLALPSVSKDLDPSGLACYLAYGTMIEPLTLHSDIHSISAGEFVWCGDPSKPREETWSRTFLPEWFDAVAGRKPARNDAAMIAVRDEARQCDPPLGVLLTPDRYAMGLAAMAHASALTATLTVGYDDASGTRQLDCLKSYSDSLSCRQTRAVVDDDWIVSHWRELHRFSDQPTANSLVVAISASLASDCNLSTVLTSAGYARVIELSLLQPLIQKVRTLPRCVRFAPAFVRDSLVSLFIRKSGLGCDFGAYPGVAGLPIEVSLAQSRRALCNADLKSLGFRANDIGLGPCFYPTRIQGAPQANSSADHARVLSWFAGPTRDPYVAATVRDFEMFGSAADVDFHFPWMFATAVDGPLAFAKSADAAGSSVKPSSWNNDVQAVRASLRASNKQTHSDTDDEAILPLRHWFLGPLLFDCQAAIDELASCSLLKTTAVRRLWDAFGRGQLSTRAAATMISLGLYLERIRTAS